MYWNFFNIIIFIGASFLLLVSMNGLIRGRKNNTVLYLLLTCLGSSLGGLQFAIIDSGILSKFPEVNVVFNPFQFLVPVLLTAFTFSYLDRMYVLKNYYEYFLLPFLILLSGHIFFQVDIIPQYDVLSKISGTNYGSLYAESVSLLLYLGMGILNYRTIKNYEDGFGNLPYKVVVQKTGWLKTIFLSLTFLCLIWGLGLVSAKMDVALLGRNPNYVVWLGLIIFQYLFFFLGIKHLEHAKRSKQFDVSESKAWKGNFQVEGLQELFSNEELFDVTEERSYHIVAILGYFATSLHDKDKVEKVLWDIVENCISKLGLEDCVVYTFDKERNVLEQKAAYGNKNAGKRNILSPLEIPIGKGVVGTVAKTGQSELLPDTGTDPRYIVDDKIRFSELAVPLFVNGEIFGVLDSEHSEKGFFTQSHLKLFQLIAKLMAKKLQQLTLKKDEPIINGNAYYTELTRLLEKEKAYRNPELSLTTVADKLNISSTYLSQLVNKRGGQNFSEHINTYRVREAAEMLIDSRFKDYTILAIGLEAGFNSKSVFYTSFKKYTGLTPTQFRKQRKESTLMFS